MKKSLLLFLSISSVFQMKAQINYDEVLGGNLNTITTAVPFLLISPDSRSGAMGDVGVATTPDASSMHWNPAKLSFTRDDIGISVSIVPWLRELVPDINLQYIGGYYKLNENEAIGYELRYFSLGDITFTDISGNVIGQYKPNEMAIGSAYSRKLSRNFSLAISGRYIYSNLTGGQSAGGTETVAGQSIATDVSTFYTKPISIANKKSDLSFGMNISNIGNKISYTETITRDFIPINLRLGTDLTTKMDDYNKISLSFDLNKLLVPSPPLYNNDGEMIAGKDPNVAVVEGMFQSFGDAPGEIDENGNPVSGSVFREEMREINISAGLEYWYANQFALRAGYFHEHDTKGGRKYLTFGSGVKYNVFALDFSYLISTSNIGGTNPLANTMRFTLVFDLGAMGS
ncbi:MAG: type IX secretion system outer membrane channel protein PorV [Flavobacteriales bacterium]|nr:type IX secretion system outer membrane channel protein PorV [Flavobacteriales bacterium]MBT6699189.1 type IX secretion system outer membrane channel protein PorV [Flavobacteriales bacterium]MBT6815494.1 type IX secretion system outer membrane channel protein PorV [Flavobacteriales bacterium]MBT7619633.1 type IX secretion system outer membrane channel protein PorV [Flavobacteriales bacterium]MBT7726304.1 type IX secretion system outer membrane channel protein PorV [Flavobacteriales bacterium